MLNVTKADVIDKKVCGQLSTTVWGYVGYDREGSKSPIDCLFH